MVKRKMPVGKDRLLKKKSSDVTTPVKSTLLSRSEEENDGELPDDHCPICQMPFRILTVQTRTWHMAECMEVDRSSQIECSMSVHCDSTIVSHYLKVTHFHLAGVRSGREYSMSDDSIEELPPSTLLSSGSRDQISELIDMNTLPYIVLEPEPTPSTLDFIDPGGVFMEEMTEAYLRSKRLACEEASLERPLCRPSRLTVQVAASAPHRLKYKWPPVLLAPLHTSVPTSKSVDIPFGYLLRSGRYATGRHPWKKPRTKQLTISSLFGYPEKPEPKLEATRSSSVETGLPAESCKLESIPSASVYASSACDTDASDYRGVMKRRCPQYKRLPDVPFTVDAFRYGEIPGITAYFLSHFHYDHYEGLTSKFHGELYCSQVTANLVKLKLRVGDNFIRPLPMNAPRVVRGVEISLIDANHCPGSVMFVFRYSDGRTVLHTGDFRADAQMLTNSCLKPLRVDYLYLDTTYCQPIYDFPTQKDVLDFVVTVAQRQMAINPKTLFVCGSYTVGKEKVFTAIAQALKMRVFAMADKRRILHCLEDKSLDNLLTDDNRQAQIHVLRMNDINFKVGDEATRVAYSSSATLVWMGWKSYNNNNSMRRWTWVAELLPPIRAQLVTPAYPPQFSRFLHTYLAQSRFTHLMALKPTGWEFNSKSADRSRTDRSSVEKCSKFTCRDGVTIYGIPYSEHSSFSELREFVHAVNPGKIIPTVNVSGQRAQAQEKILTGWTSGQTESTTSNFKSTIDTLLKKSKLAGI